MEKILVEDLIQYKMLPFDLYNDKGIKLISAGEILTSGKLLRVSQYETLYKKFPSAKKTSDDPIKPSQEGAGLEEAPPTQEKPSDFVFHDDIINMQSKIDPEFQVGMKSTYAYSINSLKSRDNKDAIEKVNNVKAKILTEVGAIIDEVKYSSQLKLLGDYHNCHSLNTAIFAAAFGFKLEFDSDMLELLTQSALLHDIGMTKFPEELLNKAKLSNKDSKILEKHTLIGFKILKDELKMPEEVCLAALEHHENNDGSGYPYGISGEQISETSMIVSLCSFFDELTSGKTKHKVKNTKDALKIMLEYGSHKFSPELLYKFVNMFNYSDLHSFDDMVR